MEEILAAVATLQMGDPSEGRRQLLALWYHPARQHGAQQRCVMAHFLADTEQDAIRELDWDLLALEAATGSRSASGDPVSANLGGFLPSLHLNVGDAYRRSGDLQRAMLHAEAGLHWGRRLPETSYAQMIVAGLHRLQQRLSNPAARES